MDANATRSRVFIAQLTAKVQMGCAEVLRAPDWQIQTSRPPKEPDNQVMLPYRLPFHGVVISSNIDFKGEGRQPSLQPLLQKGKHDSDRASPGVFSVRSAFLFTWHPRRWWRHPCVPHRAWRPAPGALLPEEMQGLTMG